MTKTSLVDFDINDELNEKFLYRIKKLDRRTKKFLKVNGLDNLENFRSHFLNMAGNSHIGMVRGVGIKTEQTLTSLLQKTFNKNHVYVAESKDYMKDIKKLSCQAKSALAHKGLGMFETFYYVYFIKRQSVSFDHYPFVFVRKELKQFIKLRHDSIRAARKNFKIYIQS